MTSLSSSCGFAATTLAIGSHTALVAPVTVGDGAYVATGSVITADVPADALSIARARQVDKPGRAKGLRARLKAQKR